MEPIQRKAEEARKFFKLQKRDSGGDFWIADGRPDWLEDLCFEAHDGMLPDDYKYECIVDALDAIIEQGDEDEAREAMTEQVEHSYHALGTWLASHGERFGFVDEARADFGPGEDVGTDIQRGMAREREQVFSSVWASLTELCGAEESD